MITIECLSHKGFDNKMMDMGITDANVDTMSDKTFISIIGTEPCLKYYLNEEDTKHYFSGEHNNVLNLEFDDLDADIVYNGHTFKAMTMEQAEKAVDFIESSIRNGVTEYYVHCRAGISRSRAFCEAISRMLEDNEATFEYADRERFARRVNSGVLRRLSHAYWKKHRMYEYEHNDEYPDDLVHNKGG